LTQILHVRGQSDLAREQMDSITAASERRRLHHMTHCTQAFGNTLPTPAAEKRAMNQNKRCHRAARQA
jgi:hypothetical protein